MKSDALFQARCPVTLKVIGEKYAGNELVGALFLREGPRGNPPLSPECCLGFLPRQNRSK
jgi:hypothetical protein